MNLCLTLEGLRELIRDLRASGQHPYAIIVSEIEKRDLKNELMAWAKELSPDAKRVDDEDTIGFIEGAVIVSHKDVPRGKCRVMLHKDALDRNRDIVVH